MSFFVFILKVVVLPVLTAGHPDLPYVCVHWRRPQGRPGGCGEQRDILLWLQPAAAGLPRQLQYRAGSCSTE